jgi:hypothetical protein
VNGRHDDRRRVRPHSVGVVRVMAGPSVSVQVQVRVGKMAQEAASFQALDPEIPAPGLRPPGRAHLS